MGAALAKKQDYTTPENWVKRKITFENGILEVEEQTVLHGLFKRRKLEDAKHPEIDPKEMYWAGDRLHRAFIRSGLGTKYGSIMSDARGRDLAAEKKQEENEIIYREAKLHIQYQKAREIVCRVCCDDREPSLEEISLLRQGLRDLIPYWDKHDKS